MERLAKELYCRRKALGWTQDAMAARLSVHRTTYAKYETGTVDPPLDTLCRLADALGCTTDALLGREE